MDILYSAFSLIAVILLLVPGIVAIEVYYRKVGMRTNLNRLQRIVFSIFLSLLSLAVLYLSTGIHFETIESSAESLANWFGILSDGQLLSLALPVIIAFYTIHFLFTIVLGYLFGVYRNSHTFNNQVLDRRPPWHYAFQESKSEEIEVILEDGSIIRGQFNEAAWDKRDHDLYIEEPKEIKYAYGDGDGHTTSLGRSMLIKEPAISYVVFTEEDPYTNISLSFGNLVEQYRDQISDEIRNSYIQKTMVDFSKNEPDSEDED
ncbi:DUF6338 family protein [Halostagnicola sp. A-GB9-2]|uniref:DUF6338 family protein n=1 Tax=Halostagnicola sp. A-GB9-2 TaxID=3048066 RepID=UPI0024BFE15D|nr:DUF6338 family protein [Halostagnicola sp. A-GB9-2]MDJ1433971.1 DUF6338 family protein [Halostagnicola sp. A-GB9-2]